MRMENIPRVRPVTKGKNPEPGEVRVPTWSCKEPAQIARATAKRKKPDMISYFRIFSRFRNSEILYYILAGYVFRK
jgi:hypothetical protein